MEHIDREMARRVWSRVLARPEEGLEKMAAQALQRADAYDRVGKTLPGSKGQLLKKMAQEERQSASTLMDAHRALTGRSPKLQASLWPRQHPLALLRLCGDSAKQALESYTRRCEDSTHSTVFLSLAARQQSHCTALSQLLTSLPGAE